MRMDVIKGEILEKVIEHRRNLHRIPELGLELPKTKEYVRSKLKELGHEPRDVGYGLVVDVGEPPYVAVRADMDALPIEELNDVPYKSTHEGKMHACGHDAHTATLLGLAEYISKLPPKRGVRLVFQPGEEGYFGAVNMIENGVLEDVEVIIGAHVGGASGEDVPPGTVLSRKGVMMASADIFKVEFVGKGGHGSAPHNAVDPIPPLVEYVNSVYLMRSREMNQVHPLVVSVCEVHSGTTFNVIPRSSRASGTVRTVDENDRKKIAKRLEEIAKSVAKTFNVDVRFEYDWGYRTTVNDPDVVSELEECSKELGVKFVEMRDPVMGGEDFAYYLEKVPGAFFFVNTNNPEKGITAPNHSPYFDVDEELLWIPLAMFVAFIERRGGW